jgi:hypothetical protein
MNRGLVFFLALNHPFGIVHDDRRRDDPVQIVGQWSIMVRGAVQYPVAACVVGSSSIPIVMYSDHVP